MVYPLFVAFLSIVFAWQVAMDYTARQRPYQALWATALVMSAIGSMGYLGAMESGSVGAFRLYYIFGALLVAPFMGLGSCFLSLSPKIARVAFWIVIALSVLGTVFILQAPVDLEALASLSGGSGQGIIQTGPWLPFMIILNVFGTVAVSGLALFSAIRSIVRRQHGLFSVGNVTIAVGFLLLGAAGSVARWWEAWDGAFWTTMAAGWLVAFGGFRIIAKAQEKRARASATVPIQGKVKST